MLLYVILQVQVEKGSGAVIVEREVDGGLESLKLQLPAVITYAFSAFINLNTRVIHVIYAILVYAILFVRNFATLLSCKLQPRFLYSWRDNFLFFFRSYELTALLPICTTELC